MPKPMNDIVTVMKPSITDAWNCLDVNIPRHIAELTANHEPTSWIMVSWLPMGNL